jgi:predicted hotdog family 3-hydroxylacyl-ACP dehydratase
MIGFILSVSSLEIKLPLFRPGGIIQIAVNEEQRIDTVSTFRCVAAMENSEAARANLMVMDVEDAGEFIEKSNYGK